MVPDRPRRLTGPSHLGRLRLLLAAGLWLAGAGQLGAQVPFEDLTATVDLDFEHWNGMTGELYFSETPGGGGALFDYDNDGDLDLYVVQGQLLNPTKTAADAHRPPPGPLPLSDRLYRNELVPSGKLRFVDVTRQSGIDARGYGMGVTAGDYDNDGWTDLYVTNFGANELWRNRGPGDDGRVTFHNVTAMTGTDDPRWSVPAAFVDLDADGRLDLFVGNYLDFTVASHRPCFGKSGRQDYCGPSAYPPLGDRLFRNLGPSGADSAVTFADLSLSSGLAKAKGGALGVIAGDFDADGKLDLYVANDQMANHLWTVTAEDPLKVENIALLSGCAVNGDGLAEASMGVDAGDVDNDGDQDLFMAHLSQETNTLYLNDGTGFFEDASQAAGLGVASWPFTGFGTRLVDFDNDGLLDVVVVNGAIKTIEGLAAKRDPFPLHQTDQIFHNQGGGRFRNITADAGPAFQVSAVSRGLAAGDLDNDGDTDLVVFNNHGATRVLANRLGNQNLWIGLDLRTAGGERPALGSRVIVRAEGRAPLYRQVRVEGSYASASDPRILVGLGPEPPPQHSSPGKSPLKATVEVTWQGKVGPGGSAVGREVFQDLEIGRYHRLVAGTGESPAAPSLSPKVSGPEKSSGSEQSSGS